MHSSQAVHEEDSIHGPVFSATFVVTIGAALALAKGSDLAGATEIVVTAPSFPNKRSATRRNAGGGPPGCFRDSHS